MALGQSDFDRALEFVRRCDRAADVDQFRRDIMGVSEIVPGHVTAYIELDLMGGDSFVQLRPAGLSATGADRVLGEFARQHPVLTHMGGTGDLAPKAISDLIDSDELHSLELHKRVLARLEVEDQIVFGLAADLEEVIGVAIGRRAAGFSRRDRDLLALLAPHAGEAFLAARARTAAQAPLTPREVEVAELLVDGLTNAEIAARLMIAPATVKRHLESIYDALGVGSRTAVVGVLLREPDFSGSA